MERNTVERAIKTEIYTRTEERERGRERERERERERVENRNIFIETRQKHQLRLEIK